MSRLSCLAACCAVVALASPARAQDYPSRPVKAIVAVGAGGTGDIFMRVLGEELHRRWRQPVVVENRPGGASNIGARACAEAPPDGYTIQEAFFRSCQGFRADRQFVLQHAGAGSQRRPQGEDGG
jgi:tripartite-type tricarboxylate transporter receptor subunit TctC